MPDDSDRKDKLPTGSEKFRSYDIATGKFTDEIPELDRDPARADPGRVKSQRGEPGDGKPGRVKSGPKDLVPLTKAADTALGPARELKRGNTERADAKSGSQKRGDAGSGSLIPVTNTTDLEPRRKSRSLQNTDLVSKSLEPRSSKPAAGSPAVPGAALDTARGTRSADRDIHSTDRRKRGTVQISGYDKTDAVDADIIDVVAKPAAHEHDNEPDTGPSDFKVKFDFEGKYMDVPEERPLRWRREKRTGCVGGILYSAFVICISILLASLAWLAASDVLGFGSVNEEVNLSVPKDFDMEDVIDLLFDAELIRYKFLFRIYAGYSSAEEKITAGSYVLNKNFDYRALVHGMTARGGARVEATVQIPEGYTLLQIFALLEEKQVCTAEDLWRSAQWYNYRQSFLRGLPQGLKLRLEGYLFPDTYNFYIGSTPEQAISKMLNEFNNKFNEQFAERAEFMGYSIHEIITIASMIEREAGNDEERPHIASVIYNRLNSKDFPLLQIDATIYYAIAGTGKPFSTDFDSPYNTYMHEGLPPGPIANPGLASIRAALYPASSKDYYYALNKSGSHSFFDTYAKQQAFVQSDDYGGR